MSKKYKYSEYCDYAHICDKEINCQTEPFCSAFRSNTQITTLADDPEAEINKIKLSRKWRKNHLI